jgi:hypothetical protein
MTLVGLFCPTPGLELSLWLKAVRIFPRWLFKGESTVGPTAQGTLGLCAKNSLL